MTDTVHHSYFTAKRLRLYVWGCIILLLSVDAWGLYIRKIAVEIGENGLDNAIFMAEYGPTACLLYFIAWRLRQQNASPLGQKACLHLAAFMESVCQFMCIAFATLVLSYLGATIIAPYRDDWLLCADRFCHFNWYGYSAWVNRHPLLGKLLDLCYNSFLQQLLVALILLAITGQFIKLQHLMLALIASSVTCIAIAAIMPATGIITYLHLDPSAFNNLRSGPGYLQVPIMEHLRHGTFPTLVLSSKHLTGLITFPSFHTCSSALLVWAFWSVPFIRWPALLLNLVVFASTPVIGEHYFIDVPAGILIAAIAIYFTAPELLLREEGALGAPTSKE